MDPPVYRRDLVIKTVLDATFCLYYLYWKLERRRRHKIFGLVLIVPSMITRQRLLSISADERLSERLIGFGFVLFFIIIGFV